MLSHLKKAPEFRKKWTLETHNTDLPTSQSLWGTSTITPGFCGSRETNQPRNQARLRSCLLLRIAVSAELFTFTLDSVHPRGRPQEFRKKQVTKQTGGGLPFRIFRYREETTTRSRAHLTFAPCFQWHATTQHVEYSLATCGGTVWQVIVIRHWVVLCTPKRGRKMVWWVCVRWRHKIELKARNGINQQPLQKLQWCNCIKTERAAFWHLDNNFWHFSATKAFWNLTYPFRVWHKCIL